MGNTFRPRVRSFAWMMMMIYFASYLTRINFTVMLVVVCNELNLSKLDLAAVVTGLTVAYGAGQIVSGMIADRLKPERLLLFGLCLAAGCNVVMSFLSDTAAMTAVWCINGFAHALLWPPMVRLMSVRLDDREYGYACVRVFWGSSIATILLYLGCPLLLGVMSWRGILRLCACGGLLVAATWVVYHKKYMLDVLETKSVLKAGGSEAAAAKKALPGYVYLPIVMIMLGIIFQGALRDGVTNWMPSFMLETFGLPEEKAIVVTVSLAVISMICSSAFNWLHQKMLRNEVFCAGVIFAVSAVCAVVLVLCEGTVALSTMMMAMIVSCMHGVNLMLITVVPKRFAAGGRVATYTGLFNSGTYIGAALSTYAFAALADAKGWSATLVTWLIVAVLGAAVCFAVFGVWKKFCREYAE